MADPYQVLGLDAGSSEADIRRRYLELVRQFPPDREPLRFTEVRAAYDQLRDPVVRLKSQLFDLKLDDSIETITSEFRHRLRAAHISTETLLRLAEQP